VQSVELSDAATFVNNKSEAKNNCKTKTSFKKGKWVFISMVYSVYVGKYKRLIGIVSCTVLQSQKFHFR
jgi:hypothetical protein